ncbi:MAG: AAA family ATPase [bacterium]|nr:AAA family ATPase [bacterium]
MTKKLLSLYGLKWNPFSPDVPTAALWVPPAIESFCWRLEQQVRDGGFALISGEPGTGKSVTLRLLAHRLSVVPELVIGVLSRPQSGVADFYRELGDLFAVSLSPHNRWCGFKLLREKWHSHLSATLWRPALIIDEAQEMDPAVLCELRLLASTEFDSRSILTVVLAGDSRLLERLRHRDLLPVASRVRVRLHLEPKTPQELAEYLDHVLTEAGNPRLVSPQLVSTLCEHAAGNFRTLCIMAAELLAAAAQREALELDEKLFFELFAPTQKPRRARRSP